MLEILKINDRSEWREGFVSVSIMDFDLKKKKQICYLITSTSVFLGNGPFKWFLSP